MKLLKKFKLKVILSKYLQQLVENIEFGNGQLDIIT